jgi:hypothetical protein
MIAPSAALTASGARRRRSMPDDACVREREILKEKNEMPIETLFKKNERASSSKFLSSRTCLFSWLCSSVLTWPSQEPPREDKARSVFLWL